MSDHHCSTAGRICQPAPAASITMMLSAFILVGSLWSSSSVVADEVSQSQFWAKPEGCIRIATFNVSMTRDRAGQLLTDLKNDHPQIQKAAAILRTVQPDVVLLNEFDYDGSDTAARLFQQSFLQQPLENLPELVLPHAFTASVNTGLPSGFDLNRNGSKADAADAYGFGQFPGQYGMLLLSRFEIQRDKVRTFQKLNWAAMPNALRPVQPASGKPWYSDAIWQQLRLSSKSHWDVPLQVGGESLHLLASHPTPPAFDGPEDRNGCRNHDEIRLWSDYLSPQKSSWLRDDHGHSGGLPARQSFVVLGDLNADPSDGGSRNNAIDQLLLHPRINASVTPTSSGGREASQQQQAINRQHRGDSAADTADFNDQSVGNLRVDYVLPSRALKVLNAGVFWPTQNQSAAKWLSASDHRLVWVDLEFPPDKSDRSCPPALNRRATAVDEDLRSASTRPLLRTYPRTCMAALCRQWSSCKQE